MKALLLDAETKTANLYTIPDPQPSAHEVLIREVAIALNPIDPLYVYNPLGATGRTIGSDFAGKVVCLGESVPSTVCQLEPGDGVAGFLQGACSVNERPGAFAEFVVCPWDLVWKVPEGMRLDEAVTVSLCGLTAAQALFDRMGLEAPFPWTSAEDSAAAIRAAFAGEPESDQSTEEPQPSQDVSVFINGAATSVGLYAAQLVRRSAEASGRSIKLYGTASPTHFQMLSASPYSYEGLVDYHDADWFSQIRNLSPASAGVDYAYDCISEGYTVLKTGSTLASKAAKMAIVRSREGGAWVDPGNLLVEPSYGAVWEGLGERVQYQGMEIPASARAAVFAAAFYGWLSSAEKSEERKLAPNPVRGMLGGLKRVVCDGFLLLGSGSVGGRSLSGSQNRDFEPLSAEKVVFWV